MNRTTCEHFVPTDLHCDHCADRRNKLTTCQRCGKRTNGIHTCTPPTCRRCDAPATHGDLCKDCLDDYE